MAKIHMIHSEGYTIVPTLTLQDPALDLKARGLLAMLLAFPEERTFGPEIMARIEQRDSKESMAEAFRVLRRAGYLRRISTRSGEIWHLADTPIYKDKLPAGRN